jgi:hypothetical protein
MHNPFDQLGKKIGLRALGPSGVMAGGAALPAALADLAALPADAYDGRARTAQSDREQAQPSRRGWNAGSRRHASRPR